MMHIMDCMMACLDKPLVTETFLSYLRCEFGNSIKPWGYHTTTYVLKMVSHSSVIKRVYISVHEGTVSVAFHSVF